MTFCLSHQFLLVAVVPQLQGVNVVVLEEQEQAAIDYLVAGRIDGKLFFDCVAEGAETVKGRQILFRSGCELILLCLRSEVAAVNGSKFRLAQFRPFSKYETGL
ncbi:MAG: hypothetical protein P4M04_03895 [Acidobacteriota bacterium]|nr:hypothetical protein [Acidobacteriota bacterium]